MCAEAEVRQIVAAWRRRPAQATRPANLLTQKCALRCGGGGGWAEQRGGWFNASSVPDLDHTLGRGETSTLCSRPEPRLWYQCGGSPSCVCVCVCSKLIVVELRMRSPRTRAHYIGCISAVRVAGGGGVVVVVVCVRICMRINMLLGLSLRRYISDDVLYDYLCARACGVEILSPPPLHLHPTS